MKIKVEQFEKTYMEMKEEEFEHIDWIDLTEEARPVYEKELQRRNPSRWQDLIAERKQCLEMSRRNRAAESVWSAEGRLNRKDYALRVVSVNGGVIVLAFLCSLALSLGGAIPSDGAVNTGIDAQQITVLAGVLIGFLGSVLIAIQAIKRLHDVNKPGSHLLLVFVPLYGFYVSFLLFFKKGTKGTNRYGDDPAVEAINLPSPLARSTSNL